MTAICLSGEYKLVHYPSLVLGLDTNRETFPVDSPRITHFCPPGFHRSPEASDMSYYLVLVGTHDNPVYESYLTSTIKTSNSTIMSVPLPSSSASFSIFGGLPSVTSPLPAADGTGHSTVGYGDKNGAGGRHVMQLVAHASLDVVEDIQWSNNGM